VVEKKGTGRARWGCQRRATGVRVWTLECGWSWALASVSVVAKKFGDF
jgi:hypothetical protein